MIIAFKKTHKNPDDGDACGLVHHTVHERNGNWMKSYPFYYYPFSGVTFTVETVSEVGKNERKLFTNIFYDKEFNNGTTQK